MATRLIVTENYAALCEKVVESILSLSKKTIAKQRRFTLALSGGSTPQGIYARMGTSIHKNKFQWRKMHFFWGDERWVSRRDPANNHRMFARQLRVHVKIPAANIHPIRTQIRNPEISAAFYEEELRAHFQPPQGEVPRFDLILLGLGQDGHIASLFPESPVLKETKRWVRAVAAGQNREPRITLTFPVLCKAKAIFLLVSGREKAAVLKKVLQPKAGKKQLPAEKLKADCTNLRIFADQAAAPRL